MPDMPSLWTLSLVAPEAFERLVRGGPTQWSGTTPEESIDIMLTLDAIRGSARSGAAIEIPADRF
jgi:hypothetical protein